MNTKKSQKKNKRTVGAQAAQAEASIDRIPKKFVSATIVGCFSVSGLVLAFFVAWVILAQVNFSYGFWHDHGGIGAAIDKYGPQNRFKKGFSELSREERIDLFAHINTAVHNGGEGLRDIEYTVPGWPPQKLLRRNEWIHLQDVANLIDMGWYVVIPSCITWFALIAFYVIKRERPPRLRKQLLAFIQVLLVIIVVVLFIGPTKVFSYMHVIAFPDGHQWFFYYQNSLMSTMMWAPKLFGWIAIEWVALTVVLYALLQYVAALVSHTFGRVGHDTERHTNKGANNANKELNEEVNKLAN